jgi:hypothetical protein
MMIEDVSGVEHRFGEDLLLVLVHAVQVDRHEQRTDLVIGDAAACDSANEEFDLFTR